MAEARRFGTAGFALGILLALCPSVLALNPALDISQYAHTAWKIRDGFTQGSIFAIAQTPDGYLWLGTQFGLLRFDGTRAVSWQPPAGQRLPSTLISSLLVSRDGTLWIGTHEGLAAWKDGRLTPYPELAGQSIFSLQEDHEGTVWIGGWATPSDGKLCAASRGSVECYGETGSFGEGVFSLHEDHNGNLWAADVNGLWRWKPGPPRRYRVGAPIYAIEETEDGRPLLMSADKGLMSLDGEAIKSNAIAAGQRPFKPRTGLRSRDGGLWIGTTDHGLLHVHNGRTDWFAESDGLSGTDVFRLFEDREGSIWAATDGGLDRFRDFAIPTLGAKQGLPARGGALSVLAAKDGGIWLNSADGVIRLQNGQTRIYRIGEGGLPGVESLAEDSLGRIWVSTRNGVAYFDGDRFVSVSGVPNGELVGIAIDPHGSVWVGHHSEGLFHLEKGGTFQRIPWSQLGRDDWAPVLAADPAADPANTGLWLGFARGGAAYLKNGEVRTSYSAEDLARVMDLKPKSDGTVWAATTSGLSRLANGRGTTMTRKNGLPCDGVQWSEEDDDHSLWLQSECGLVRITASELAVWVADPARRIQLTVFDISDGVRTFPTVATQGPRVSKSRDGKLWFSVGDGLSVIDPRHLPFNPVPPPVHIEQIKVDGKTYDASSGFRLPPRVRDVWIDYTALSLVAAEKIHFRYKLEGQDPDWKEVINTREAQYSNLAPGNYRFRVAASNNSGVWNEAGAFIDFSVAPAYYQTTWFRLSAVAVFLALLAGLYQLRLRQVARQFNMRLEERVNERTRIARDLHDTLLQSFHGVLLKFSALKYLIRDRPAEAEEALERFLEQARHAVTEGRDAVQGLRDSTVVANDLARAIGTFVEGLAADQTHGNSPEFRMHVEGKSRDLPPLIRDEVYRIACEALRNAFRHAGARRIEVDIRYDQRQFRFRVRDDGKGIDPQVLSAGGRTGHHGLAGMHERAKVAGGKLVVWSELNSGVEIELTIPASFAYAKPPSARQSMSSGMGT